MFGQRTRLISIIIVALLSACRWNDPPPLNTIVFGLSSEPKTLDPRFATDANGQRVADLIFSGLIRFDADLKTVGDLASSWTQNAQGFQFKLRPGIRFHNGSPLTAEDLIFSVKEYQSSRSPFSAQFAPISDVQATYDIDVGGQINLLINNYSSSLEHDLPSLKILPKAVVKKHGEDFYAKPIGTGPFAYDRREGNNFFLKRNDKYFGDKAVTEYVQFKVVKDSTTRFQKMYKGQIDIIQSDIPFSKVKVFKNSEKFRVVAKPGLSTAYLLINLRKPTFQSQKVRRAMSAAINRNDFVEFVHEGYSDPATSILTNANPYQLKGLSNPTMNRDQIKKILGAIDTPIILKTSNTQEAVANGRVLTHQLTKAGMNVEQQTYEWGTYYEDVRSGKFDLAIMKWVGVLNPDIYRISLHSEMTPPGRNRGYYNNKKLDELVDKAVTEPDTKRRQSLYNEAQALVFQDLPTIPLWYEKQVAIVHKRIKNYDLPTRGDFSALTKVYKE